MKPTLRAIKYRQKKIDLKALMKAWRITARSICDVNSSDENNDKER